jgi:hypothetical protein
MGMAVFGYKNWILKLFRFIHLPIFTIVAIVMGVQAIRGKFPASIAMFWVGGWVWGAYWMFWRACHTVEVEGDTFRWWSTFRHGELAISELIGNRNFFGIPGGMQTLRRSSGRPILVASQGRSWLLFLDELNKRHPQHPFHASRLARFATKWPGSGGCSTFYHR